MRRSFTKIHNKPKIGVPRGRGARFCNLADARAKSAFTLIEVVIYIALLSVVTSFVLVVFYQMLGDQDQHRNRVEVDQEANFMMQKMLWALTGTEKIDEPTGGATSSRLAVDKWDYPQNPIVFDVAARSLRISKASSTPAPLSGKKVFVDSFMLTHILPVQGAPEGVRISLTVLSSDISRPQASTTLEHTIYLRQ